MGEKYRGKVVKWSNDTGGKDEGQEEINRFGNAIEHRKRLIRNEEKGSRKKGRKVGLMTFPIRARTKVEPSKKSYYQF